MSKKKKDDIDEFIELIKNGDMGDYGAEMQAFQKILEAIDELGWMIAIPDQEEVEGVVIGTENFVEEMLMLNDDDEGITH